MRSSLTAVLLFACFVAPVAVSARQATAASTAAQATPLLVQSLAAQTGGVQITDVTLTGTATIPGLSGSQTGSIVLVATATGRTQVTTTSPSGDGIQDYTSGTRVGNYSGADGVNHKMPPQSLPSIHPAWFFPAFILAAGSSSADFGASDMGQETRHGVVVRHLAVWRQPGGPSPSLQAIGFQHASKHDVYLDPATLLPAILIFRTRAFNPNNPDAPLLSIPTDPVEIEEEIHYSSYQQVQGVPVPFHIQLFLRGTLISDIQLSSAKINTGVTIAAIN
jgi:hypothetical protein